MEKLGRFQACALVVLLAVGCGAADVGSALDAVANEDADPEAEPGTASDYPEAVVSALAVLAHQLDRSVDSLTIETYEEVLWPDACLGLADKDEMCAQVIVNGWRIDVRADDGAWELHTDATGEQVRWRPAGS